uniref:hypothetical protein n=1 Tax=Mangrovimonas sp. ST2L15 TaxID=1645916 RepID=UPI000AAAB865
TFTIVRPVEDKFYFEFTHGRLASSDELSKQEINNEEYSNSLKEASFACKKDGEHIFKEFEKTNSIEGNKVITNITEELSDQKEYHISGKVIMHQNLKEDREYSFGSKRIIDDLTVFIEHDNNINVIFSPSGVDSIEKNNAFPDHKLAFINRDVLLPGEKFKLFFYK